MLRYTYIDCLVVFGMDKQRRRLGSTVLKIQVFYFKCYAYLGLMSGCIVTLVYVRECTRTPNLSELLFTYAVSLTATWLTVSHVRPKCVKLMACCNFHSLCGICCTVCLTLHAAL